MQVDHAQHYLTCLLGKTEAERIMGECLKAVGTLQPQTPEELILFAEQLMEHGDIPHLVGRNLKSKALQMKGMG